MTGFVDCVENLLGRAGFGDGAFVEHMHGFGGAAGEVHGVGDHDHGLTAGGQVGHHLQHFGGHARIERAGGLVEQHRLGLHRQCPGDGHALLLAAGKLVGPHVDLFGQPDAVQERFGSGDRFVRGQVSALECGASITLPSTVRCGNKLNCWNTMPSCWRHGVNGLAGSAIVISRR